MEMKEFMQNFASALDCEEVESLTPQTEFRELDEWSSLGGLSVIAMADTSYGVSVSAQEVRAAKTIGDLYELINGKR